VFSEVFKHKKKFTLAVFALLGCDAVRVGGRLTTNRQPAPCNIPEGSKPQLHRGESPKSRYLTLSHLHMFITHRLSPRERNDVSRYTKKFYFSKYYTDQAESNGLH
jgi:hypothetical protein